MELHKEVISAQPWAVCLKPPLATESHAEFHQRRRLESQTTRMEISECVSMGGEDALVGIKGEAGVAAASSLREHSSRAFSHDEI